MDRTIKQRKKRERDRRSKLGWKQVSVWVPSTQDAEELKRIAAEMRAKVTKKQLELEL